MLTRINQLLTNILSLIMYLLYYHYLMMVITMMLSY